MHPHLLQLVHRPQNHWCMLKLLPKNEKSQAINVYRHFWNYWPSGNWLDEPMDDSFVGVHELKLIGVQPTGCEICRSCWSVEYYNPNGSFDGYVPSFYNKFIAKPSRDSSNLLARWCTLEVISIRKALRTRITPEQLLQEPQSNGHCTVCKCCLCVTTTLKWN